MCEWTKDLPSTIKIAVYDIALEIKDGNWAASGNKWGQFACVEQRIDIQGNMPNRYKFMDSLLHEITHAIWWAYGIEDEDKEERVVSAMATGWAQVYRDNPVLAEWIFDMVKQDA